MNVFTHQFDLNKEKYKKFIMFGEYSRPNMLIVETVNMCNNNCIICAYSKMCREKKIMHTNIFKKIISDYEKIGGGVLSLTPVVGEIFLDRDLVSRYEEIRKHPLITEVSFTTNAVKANEFNDADLSFVLQNTSRIHISIYGIDENEYQMMTMRNQYVNLVKSIKRILYLVDDTSKILFGFRSLKQYKKIDYENWILENFGIDISFGFTNQFANWGGVLDTKEKLPFDATWMPNVENKNQCLIPLVACQVFVDGKVSFCPCCDFDNDKELHLGSIQDNTLLEIYNNSKTMELWNFKQKTPNFCLRCSFYKSIDTLKEHEFMFKHPIDFIGG